MNLRYVLKQLGLLLVVLSLLLLAVAAWSGLQLLQDEPAEAGAFRALLIAAVSGLAFGGILWGLTRSTRPQLGRREALLLVALSWLAGAALAALPYLLWAHLPDGPAATHPFNSPVNCYFEAMSGLTTTGATILTDIDSLPRSLLLWRALTQWIGGLGIVVLFVAVLPTLGVGGKRLFQVEAPGPATEGLQPHIRQTARVLLYIYLVLSATQILAVWLIGRTSLFDAVCHTFTTLATAGFSTRNASIGAYQSRAVEIIIICFMVLGGVNFGLYFALIRGKLHTVWRDPELRTYLGMMVVGSAIIVLCLAGQSITTTTGRPIDASTGAAIRYGVFTTVSIATTTGYCTADFNTWPFLAKAVLILLMFIGGSAGSTAGGIKVIRIWIAFKVILSEIERVFRPSVVRPVRVGSTTIDDELKLATLAYVVGIVILFVLGSGAVMLLEQWTGDRTCDYTTAASASIASLFTIGPGLAMVGAIENYGWMSSPTKLVLCLLMALGRLEVFAIIVLFTPRFWRGD